MKSWLKKVNYIISLSILCFLLMMSEIWLEKLHKNMQNDRLGILLI